MRADKEQAVIRLHLADRTMTQRDIAMKVGISQSMVSVCLQKARDRGLIERIDGPATTTPKQQALGMSPKAKRGGRPRKRFVNVPAIQFADDTDEDALERARRAASVARYRPLMRNLKEVRAMAVDAVEDSLITDIDERQGEALRRLARSTSRAIARLNAINLGHIFAKGT
jgi:DNA-binding MarR family transcriptional regulator